MENLEPVVKDPSQPSDLSFTLAALSVCGEAIGKLDSDKMKTRLIVALAILFGVREEVADALNM